MRFASAFGADRRWRCCGQPGVGRLTDLDAAVGDELGDDEADGRGEHQAADAPGRGEDCAGPCRAANRYRRHSAQQPFAEAEAAQDQNSNRP